eukprot:s472_g3.t1
MSYPQDSPTQFDQREGEEILALDGEPVDAMSPESFKVALKRRPLVLRFRLPESDGPIDVTADASVQKIGLTFTQLPPEPVVVSKVASGTWAETIGFRGGEEIVAVNGLDCIAMGQHEFKALLKSRPLTLRFFPPEDPQETAAKDGKVNILEEQQREEAALKIQEQQREEAALKIQAVQRGKAAREATAEEKKQREEAAVKIQSVHRGKAARAAMAESSKEQPASKQAAPKPKASLKDKTSAGATAEQKNKPSKSGKTDPEEQQREEAAQKI